MTTSVSSSRGQPFPCVCACVCQIYPPLPFFFLDMLQSDRWGAATKSRCKMHDPTALCIFSITKKTEEIVMDDGLLCLHSKVDPLLYITLLQERLESSLNAKMRIITRSLDNRRISNPLMFIFRFLVRCVLLSFNTQPMFLWSIIHML